MVEDTEYKYLQRGVALPCPRTLDPWKLCQCSRLLQVFFFLGVIFHLYCMCLGNVPENRAFLSYQVHLDINRIGQYKRRRNVNTIPLCVFVVVVLKQHLARKPRLPSNLRSSSLSHLSAGDCSLSTYTRTHGWFSPRHLGKRRKNQPRSPNHPISFS